MNKIDIKSNEIAIDCGANIGDITNDMAKQGGTVYAFEPNPYAFNVLKERFKSNKNVICINKGVWDRNSKMQLYFHKEFNYTNPVHRSESSSIFPTKSNIDPSNSVDIEIIDLTEFIRGLKKRVKLLKMDIEGAEYDLLEKMISTDIHLNIDSIIVETHARKIAKLREKDTRLRNMIKEKQITNIDLTWR